MAEQLLNFIGGEWVAPSTGQWADNTNPADTRQVLNRWPLSAAEDVDRAVAAARAALPAWRATPAPARGAILFKAARIFESRLDELARALTREEGKLLAEASGEVRKMLNLLEFMAGEGRRLNGETIPSEIPSTFAYTVRVPRGVVGLITPWNFPVAIPVWKAAPALVAGNTVVLKPAEQTPWTAKIITEVFAEAGLPPGVLNTVFGTGDVVGDRLVKHPDVAAISFTGSTEIGLHIYATGARDNKPVQCEMGGKNPIIVLEDADLELAVAATAMGGFGSTGQRCTATSRAIVHEDVYDAFVEGLAAAARAVVVGDGLDPKTTMGPSIDQAQLDQVLKYLEIARSEGARVVVGGARATDGELAHGLFPQPTVLADVTRDMRVAREEIFGPVVSVIKVGSLDEALEVANDCEYGLASSLYTRDVNRVFRYVDRIETGILHVNNPTVGGEAQLPFGGLKNTGVGPREQGKTAIEFFTELKTVYIDYTGTVRRGNLF